MRSVDLVDDLRIHPYYLLNDDVDLNDGDGALNVVVGDLKAAALNPTFADALLTLTGTLTLAGIATLVGIPALESQVDLAVDGMMTVRL
jgi:hypothetical protein